jgi:hypothetical protein
MSLKNAKVLTISQSIQPFMDGPEEMAKAARQLPQGIMECGNEIRVFMPKFGCINERRHQLHEVIRLSGMNLIINDTDHALLIKVASVPNARMQVYFIDNEEYFKRKADTHDAEGNFFPTTTNAPCSSPRGVGDRSEVGLGAGHHPLPRLDDRVRALVRSPSLRRRPALRERQARVQRLRREGRGHGQGVWRRSWRWRASTRSLLKGLNKPTTDDLVQVRHGPLSDAVVKASPEVEQGVWRPRSRPMRKPVLCPTLREAESGEGARRFLP